MNFTGSVSFPQLKFELNLSKKTMKDAEKLEMEGIKKN